MRNADVFYLILVFDLLYLAGEQLWRIIQSNFFITTL